MPMQYPVNKYRSSFVYYQQELDTTKTFFNRWMDEMWIKCFIFK